MGCCESCLRDQSKPKRNDYVSVPEVEFCAAPTVTKTTIEESFPQREIIRFDESSVETNGQFSSPVKESIILENSYGSTVDSPPIFVEEIIIQPKLETPVKSNIVDILPVIIEEPMSPIAVEPKAQTPPVSKSPIHEPVIHEVMKTPAKKEQKETFPGISPKPETVASLNTPVHDRNSVHAREFRIFLPHICESDHIWLPTNLIETYKKSLEVLQILAGDNNQITPESREDVYMLGQAYFGLKYRSQNKLEMKVRTENKPLFLEKWSKVKFGKKKISHYKSDILTYLSDVGYSAHHTQNNVLLEGPQYVTVSKSRTCISNGGVLIEVCELSIPEKQAKLPAAASAVPLDVESIPRKQWLSVALEGNVVEIEAFILSHHKQNALFQCIAVLQQIYEAYPAESRLHSFLPVVSGYPQWIRLLTGKVSTTEEVEQEVMTSVKALVNFIK